MKWLVFSTLVAFPLCLASISARAQTAQPAKPAPTTKPVARPAAKAPAKASANDDVIKLVEAGMSEEFILDFVNKSDKSKYNTSSVDAVVKLKKAGVTEKVISAMSSHSAVSASDSAPRPPQSAPASTSATKGSPTFRPGTKPRLVIKTLGNPSTSANSTIGNAVTDLFVTELGKTGRFTLLGPDGSDPELIMTGKVTNFSFVEHTIQQEVATARGAVLQTMYQQDATVRVDFNIASRATGAFVLTDSGIATQSHVSAVSEIATYRRLEQVGVATAESQDSMMGRTTIEAIKNAIRKISDLASGLSASSSGSAGGAAGLVRSADRYMEDDHFSQAVDAYEKALSAEPNSSEVMGKLVSAYLYNKQLSDAEDLSERLIANHGQVSMRAVHNHAFGSCDGQLAITSDKVAFIPKRGDDTFSWKAGDVSAIEQGVTVMWGEGRMPSLVVRARDSKGKDKKYDFVVTAYFVSNPGSLVQKPRDPEALADTEKLHRILIRLSKQIK